MSIAQNIQQIKETLPAHVTLVAVSKFHPAEKLQEAYDAGQRVFGESRAQELVAKQKVLPQDIEWHFIGSLQTNKVKDIAPFIHTIHSIDSLRLLQEVNKQAAKQNRIIRVLLEIHIAEEETKHGLTPDECRALLQDEQLSSFTNVVISGLMGMATFTDDMAQVEREFDTLRSLFDELKQTHFPNDNHFSILSMGMSDDYPLAIQHGSTMVRIGSSIFGVREY